MTETREGAAGTGRGNRILGIFNVLVASADGLDTEEGTISRIIP